MMSVSSCALQVASVTLTLILSLKGEERERKLLIKGDEREARVGVGPQIFLKCREFC